jgi:spore coat polysaccharide biosynthesis predicted glycosyltransferase SpsG
VFLDGYHFDASRQMALKEKGLKVAVMDDFVHLDRYPADLVVNQNYGAEASDYRGRTSGRLLIGTGYVLLREEFRDCPSPGRGNPAEVKRVLVTLGGGEVRRATSRILEALRLHDAPLEVRVLGVAGPGEDRDVTEGGAGRRHSVEYLGYSSGVSAHMKWADVGVSAGGTTVWEMARLGLPPVLGITAKNHERTVLSLERDGLCVSLGWVEKTPLSEMLRLFAGLAEDRQRRESMSTSFRGLVDGKGASRIAAAMTGEA